MQKTCIKCGHINPAAPGLETDACPGCGAIYAKAQQPAKPPRQSVLPGAPVRSGGPFIERLRAESLYPTFRQVVSMFHMLGQVLALLILVGGVLGGVTSSSVGAFIGGIILAVFTSVFFRVGKQASLMLADMSDATVRMAQQRDAEA